MIIWGFKSYVTFLTVATVICGRCQNPSAHRLHRLQKKFTLFFIPLFPYSTKFLLDCTFCGQQSSLTKEEAEAFQAQYAPPPVVSPAPAEARQEPPTH